MSKPLTIEKGRATNAPRPPISTSTDCESGDLDENTGLTSRHGDGDSQAREYNHKAKDAERCESI
jgi:hypothetical protein